MKQNDEVYLLSNHGHSELATILEQGSIPYRHYPLDSLANLPQDDNLIIIDLSGKALGMRYPSEQNIDKTVLLYVDDNFPVEKIQSFIRVTNFLFLRRGLSQQQKISTILKAHNLIQKHSPESKSSRHIVPIAWVARYNDKFQKAELFESPIILDVYSYGISFQSYSDFAVDGSALLWVVNEKNDIEEYMATVEWKHSANISQKKMECFDYGLRVEDNRFKDFFLRNKAFFSLQY